MPRRLFSPSRSLLVLSLAVVLSAFYLVRVQYASRHLQSELERLALQTRKLDQENERLQLAKRAQSTPARTEALARTRLQMHMASPANTQYVRLRPLNAPLNAPNAP